MALPKQCIPVDRALSTTSASQEGPGVEPSFLGALVGALAPTAISLISKAIGG